jgi:hypothetical protein
MHVDGGFSGQVRSTEMPTPSLNACDPGGDIPTASAVGVYLAGA